MFLLSNPLILVLVSSFTVCSFQFRTLKIFTTTSLPKIFTTAIYFSALNLNVETDFREKINSYRKSNSAKKLLQEVKHLAVSGDVNQNMTLLSFRTLQRMNRSDLCIDMIPIWLQITENISSVDLDIDCAMSMIRSMCRMGKLDLAEAISTRFGVIVDSRISIENFGAQDRVVVDASKRALPELALGYTMIGKYERALYLLELLNLSSITIDLETSKQILKFVLKESSLYNARKFLNALVQIDGLQDIESIQLLTNTYMRSIEFVKGCVSMDGLPPHRPDCTEAAFIGRSNVGKSSLINMICNRKGLAYTSKTPGRCVYFCGWFGRFFLCKQFIF